MEHEAIADPGFAGAALADLAAWTGLPLAVCRERAYRSGSLHAQEWVFWDPNTVEELRWFYRAAQGYLFTLCRPCWCTVGAVLPGMELAGKRCLDIGGGIGTDVLYMAQRGGRAGYHDLGLLNEAFTRSRWECHAGECEGEVVFGRRVISGGYDVVTAFDVIEHVPDWPRWLREDVLPMVRRGGAFCYSAPFTRNGTVGARGNVGLHVTETESLVGVMSGAGFREVRRLETDGNADNEAVEWVRR